jgi:hypothetical protein
MAIEPPVLDPDQLKRIESVHRGFLYQHLYAAGCLLLAAGADASSVVVEADEDIEIVYANRRRSGTEQGGGRESTARTVAC